MNKITDDDNLYHQSIYSKMLAKMNENIRRL